MTTPAPDLTADSIRALIEQRVPATYATNATLYGGDAWRGGQGWVGPAPATTDASYTTVLEDIKRAFVSANKVREVVWRHQAAVVGVEPAWGFAPVRALDDNETPTADEQALIDEAEAALTAWWDGRGIVRLLQDAVATLLLGGVAPLRLFVPDGLLAEAQGVTLVPRAADLASALGYVWLEAPAPTQAAIITNTRTMRETGLYTATVDGATVADVVRVNAASLTELITFRGDDTSAPVTLPLGGRLTMAQLLGPALITPDVVRQQDLLNMALTMLGRNVVQGGFLERIILNAQLPGEFETGSDGVRRWVPYPLTVGAGTTNVLMGEPIVDPLTEKITGYTSPSVVYRDPVSPDTFERTRQIAYAGILEETRQLHALTTNDGSLSGESRKQARAEFEASLGPTQTTVEAALRWLLETALTMAAVFTGQPERFAALRAVVTCRIETGPIDPNDQDAVRKNVTAGLMSEETGMGRLGIDDPDAERAKIAVERDERMARAPVVAAPPSEDTNVTA